MEFLTDKEINLRENYNTVMGQFQQSSGMTKRFSSDPWGFCIANGDNQQTGADNLFLVSFPEANSVIWIDYAHTKDLWGNGELLSSLGNIDDDTKEVVGKIACFFPGNTVGTRRPGMTGEHHSMSRGI